MVPTGMYKNKQDLDNQIRGLEKQIKQQTEMFNGYMTDFRSQAVYKAQEKLSQLQWFKKMEEK